MDVEKVSEILSLVMDYIEEAFNQLIIMQGKQALYVLYICIGLTVFSVILELCGYYTFISLPEGIIASIFALIVVALDFRNTKLIKSIRLRFKAGGKNER